MSARRNRPDSQEQSDLEISVITSVESEAGAEARGLTGLVGKLFRLPWVGSEPADHDRGRELRRAVRNEDLPRVQKMLRDGVGVNESQEASLACIATRRQNADLLEILIQAGVDLDQGDRRNRASRVRTPLHEAARKGWLEGVNLLLNAGANVNVEDDNGATPLLLAVRASKLAVARRLLQSNASLARPRKARLGLLHEASTPEMAQLLLDAGVAIDEPDVSGATALHHQAKAGRLAMVDFLLRNGAQVHAQDERGRTALFAVGGKGDAQGVTQRLIDAGASLTHRDHEQNAFVHLAAARYINPKALEWIYEKTLDQWALKNHAGETALDIVATRGFQPLANRIRMDVEKTRQRASRLEPTKFSLFDPPSP